MEKSIWRNAQQMRGVFAIISRIFETRKSIYTYMYIHIPVCVCISKNICTFQCKSWNTLKRWKITQKILSLTLYSVQKIIDFTCEANHKAIWHVHGGFWPDKYFSMIAYHSVENYLDKSRQIEKREKKIRCLSRISVKKNERMSLFWRKSFFVCKLQRAAWELQLIFWHIKLSYSYRLVI
jgi:hypothetical protein